MKIGLMEKCYKVIVGDLMFKRLIRIGDDWKRNCYMRCK